MKIAIFSAKPYDRAFFEAANEAFQHTLVFFENRLTEQTASLAAGYEAVCVFTNDDLNAKTLASLKSVGIQMVALRCAGYNNVDLKAAAQLQLPVVRVPAYSPHAVAEHAMGLILTLNRKLHKAYNRVREGNFALNGLLGFDLHQKTIGIIGLGQIGQVFAQIALGFGCKVLAYDPFPVENLPSGIQCVPLEALFSQVEILSLHCPLTSETHHLINPNTIAQMKPGVMIINTSRGGVIDTHAVIDGLKSKKIGALGLDVYEEEAKIFFEDLSATGVEDDIFARLLTFPNVIITGHQGFFTREAMANIAHTTLKNIADCQLGFPCPNQIMTP